MTMRIERRGRKEIIIIDTNPSKKIRRAQRRIEKRQREIHRMFERKVSQ